MTYRELLCVILMCNWMAILTGLIVVAILYMK
jgi:hypothetical protein